MVNVTLKLTSGTSRALGLDLNDDAVVDKKVGPVESHAVTLVVDREWWLVGVLDLVTAKLDL